MHRCYVPHASDGLVEVADDQAHHIANVLRLGVGAIVSVFDGEGREWLGRISSVTRAKVVITLGERKDAAPEPPVEVTLAIGLLKGDQMSQVVRDATALGVRRVVPFLSRHTAIARPSAWADLRQRWQRIAVSAASQSGRAVVPEIADVIAFEELLQSVHDRLVVCVEPAQGQVPDGRVGQRPEAATVVIGPEGGWAPDEIARAREGGGVLVSLGPRTLRAELAPVVALATLWSAWGWE
jgi:16S rRNA (uracil1498-N3)-methyltransferase